MTHIDTVVYWLSKHCGDCDMTTFFGTVEDRQKQEDEWTKRFAAGRNFYVNSKGEMPLSEAIEWYEDYSPKYGGMNDPRTVVVQGASAS